MPMAMAPPPRRGNGKRGGVEGVCALARKVLGLNRPSSSVPATTKATPVRPRFSPVRGSRVGARDRDRPRYSTHLRRHGRDREAQKDREREGRG